jgi:hypothetical protein
MELAQKVNSKRWRKRFWEWISHKNFINIHTISTITHPYHEPYDFYIDLSGFLLCHSPTVMSDDTITFVSWTQPVPRLSCTNDNLECLMDTMALEPIGVYRRTPANRFKLGRNSNRPGDPLVVTKDMKAWEIYNHKASEIDREMTKDWNDSLNTLLIFVSHAQLRDSRHSI